MIKTLSEQLVALQVLNQTQVADLEKKAAQAGQPINSFIIKNQLVSEEKIAKAFASMLSIPLIEKIAENDVNPDLLSKIPFKFLKENMLIPIKHQDKLTIVVVDPTNYQPIDELKVLLSEQAALAVATTRLINESINRYYPLEGTKQMIEELGQEDVENEIVEFGEVDEKDILLMAQEAPIIKLVNHMLFQAVKRSASDIHIEPMEKEISVRFRIDGILHPALNPPKRIQGALASRIKIMANLNIAEKRKPQDGGIQIKVADKAIDIRVSILPTVFGEKIVMRLFDKSHGFIPVTDLAMSKRDNKVLLHAISLPNGIVLVTGPTGSGKTTTLYAILNYLNKPDVSIVTVEDPVEQQMNGIAQVPVNEKAGVTFATALRSILRQDPDIILIGETRDHETAQIAIQASLTGHLVFSTLHTNSAAASITRLLDMGVEPFLIASTITCIVAQRLVRKLCPHCKQIYKPTPEILKTLGISEKEAEKITFYKAVGCDECANTGYRGRLPIFEVLHMTPEIAKLTVQRADAALIQQAAITDGMTVLVIDGIEKIKQGLTSIEEVLSVAATN